MQGGVPTTKELLRALDDQGWSIEKTKQGHYKAKGPAGAGLVTFCNTDEPRGMKNNISELRRNGFQWPPPERVRPAKTVDLGSGPFTATAVRAAATPPDMDALFKNLKDTRAELAGLQAKYEEAERECDRRRVLLGEAQEAARAAKDEVDMMKRLVMEAKAEFDQVFDVSA